MKLVSELIMICIKMITSDLANPESNRNKTAGFTDQEREAFTKLLEAGFVVSLFIYFEDVKVTQ